MCVHVLSNEGGGDPHKDFYIKSLTLVQEPCWRSLNESSFLCTKVLIRHIMKFQEVFDEFKVQKAGVWSTETASHSL